MLENLLLEYFVKYTERIYPDSLNANFVTIIGQVPQLITTLIFLFHFGFDPMVDQPVENHKYFIWSGLALMWFNHHDLMDGMRARRQKLGSPFGRLLDEASDMIQMACYTAVFCHAIRIDNNLLNLVYLALNIICFTMEMKYLLCNELILNLGDIGSVEIENLFAIFFIIAGLYGP